MMLDLSDTTIIIPLRLDSQDRHRNLLTVVSYFQKYTTARIHIVEDDRSTLCPAGIYKRHGIRHTLLLNDSPMFCKTKCINRGVKENDTPYFAIYDVDVLVKLLQLDFTLELLRSNQADVVYPYDGRFMNVPESLVASVVSSLSVDHIPDSSCSLGLGMPELTADRQSFGGAVFFNRDKFISGGMGNEKFISYGPEDAEFWVRFKKLGYNIMRVGGPVYHLHHVRGMNSLETHPNVDENHVEFKKIREMTPEALKAYVDTWTWHKKETW